MSAESNAGPAGSTTEPTDRGGSKPDVPISRKDYTFIALWSIGVLALSAAVGYGTLADAHRNRVAAAERHNARIDPKAQEAGLTPPETTPPPGHEKDEPAPVKIGIYVDRVTELSIRDTSWTVEFYIWFKWKGKDFDPGENFQVVDGTIESKDAVKKSSMGDDHYALYRVQAKITKSFNVSRFPCDDHLLTIAVEDRGLQSYQLRYVADEKGSSISSRVKFPGYVAHRQTTTVKPHSYKSSRGDPDVPTDFKATYSQFVFGVWIERPDLGFFVKMFQGLYAAVAIALLAFFVKPTHVDPRFGLGVGAFFAAVANTYVVSSALPESGAMTLTDVINGIGMGVIFLTLVQSTISLDLYDRQGKEAASRLFDIVSAVVIGLPFAVLNIAIPLVAMRQ